MSLSYLTLMQVYKHVEGARLLLCAPQNFSADLLFKALTAAGVTTDYMIRLVDPRIPPAQVCYLHCKVQDIFILFNFTLFYST